jgi:hypothetical protein
MAETLNLVKLGQGTKAGLLRVISYEFWQPRLAKAHIELGLRQAVELKANFDMHAAKYQRRIEFIAGTHTTSSFNLEHMVDTVVEQTDKLFQAGLDLQNELDDYKKKYADAQVRVSFRHLHRCSPINVNKLTAGLVGSNFGRLERDCRRSSGRRRGDVAGTVVSKQCGKIVVHLWLVRFDFKHR